MMMCFAINNGFRTYLFNLGRLGTKLMMICRVESDTWGGVCAYSHSAIIQLGSEKAVVLLVEEQEAPPAFT